MKDAAATRACSWPPRAAPAWPPLRKLKASGHLSPDDTVVLFNTGTGYKYVENMLPRWDGPYHWQPALFEAMEKGSSTIPEARRNWVIARVILNDRPLTLGSSRVAVGNYASRCCGPTSTERAWPSRCGAIDMREVYPDVNAIAPAPRGETVFKGPVTFETGKPARAAVRHHAAADAGKVTLTVSYGDRRLVVTFVR